MEGILEEAAAETKALCPGGGGGSGFVNSPFVTDSVALTSSSDSGIPPQSSDPNRGGSGEGGVDTPEIHLLVQMVEYTSFFNW